MTIGVLSPADQDKFLTALASALVDVLGPDRALAAVDHIAASPAAGCCKLARVREQAAAAGITADSPADLGPDGEQLARLERADYDGGYGR